MSEAKAILTNYHALVERQYVGDTDAICALLDLTTAVANAKLTDRQREALRLVYGANMTQKDAGLALGVERVTVARMISEATSKIDRVYRVNKTDEKGTIV